MKKKVIFTAIVLVIIMGALTYFFEDKMDFVWGLVIGGFIAYGIGWEVGVNKGLKESKKRE
ncbi:hypothetical protein ACFLUZ_02795 [Chloroflexota bacterium]